MFLDANMSSEVEQKLKENFPNSIKREIFKVTSIFKPKKSISKKHVLIFRVPKGGSLEPWSPEISVVEPGALIFY